VAKSPSEHIRDLNLEVRGLTEREAALRTLVSELRAADERRRNEVAEVRKEIADLRQENAVLRQQLQDHVEQYREWDRRRWGFISLLIGAVFTLASGLIVTLAKK